MTITIKRYEFRIPVRFSVKILRSDEMEQSQYSVVRNVIPFKLGNFIRTYYFKKSNRNSINISTHIIGHMCDWLKFEIMLSS